VPTHVIAVRSSLPEADRERLRAALLSLNEPGMTELRDKVFTSKLTPVDEAAHLDSIAEALAFAAKAPVR
jgi:ABC-type phosphate/phosphonate transport system substrate-binding protein